jgi:hypothetical protein
MSVDLEAVIREFVTSLRQTFAEEQSRNQGAFERRAAKIFKKQIMSCRAGRPRREAVTRATQLQRQGQSWQQIFALCLPTGLEGADRNMAQLRLRSAVRARRSRERRSNQSAVVTKPGR